MANVGYRETALRYGWFIVAVLVIFFIGSMLGERSARADEPYDSEELKFLKLINQYRQSKGLTPLILSDALTVASERHSRDMGRHNFFAHNSLKSSHFPAGSEPWDRMKLSGYDYPNSYRAENLAAAYETAEKAFEAWRKSPGHNRNMLDGNQKVIGIARVRVPGSAYDWYWTTDFGSEVDPSSHPPGKPPASKKKQGSKETSPSDTRRAGKSNK